jgi:uncharacterized protein
MYHVSLAQSIQSTVENQPEIRLGRFLMNMKELVEILACPQCKGPVKLVDDEKGILCEKCSLLYEIRDGIPVMLVSEAKKVVG